MRNSWAVLLGLGALLALSLVFGLAVGSAVDPGWEIIISIRLPRVVLGLLVGAALGTAGAMLQALLHNPLADPFVLGISGGAALGGVTALGVGGSIGIATLSIPLAAFVGALLATLLLYVVAGRAGAGPSHALLLTGVIFNAFASSLIILITSLLDSSGITSVFLWLIGSIRHVDVWMIGAVGVILCLGLMAGIREAYALNLISQGEETALHLGVDVARTRLMTGGAAPDANAVPPMKSARRTPPLMSSTFASSSMDRDLGSGAISASASRRTPRRSFGGRRQGNSPSPDGRGGPEAAQWRG